MNRAPTREKSTGLKTRRYNGKSRFIARRTRDGAEIIAQKRRDGAEFLATLGMARGRVAAKGRTQLMWLQISGR